MCLTLAENPVSSLAHYHLFLIFKLRSLEILDGQRISPQDREQAHQRFHMGKPYLIFYSFLRYVLASSEPCSAVFTEEVERLEKELELRAEETDRLQRERTIALEQLERQETVNQNLRQQNQDQQHSHEELKRELDTKSELVGHIICSSVKRVETSNITVIAYE